MMRVKSKRKIEIVKKPTPILVNEIIDRITERFTGLRKVKKYPYIEKLKEEIKGITRIEEKTTAEKINMEGIEFGEKIYWELDRFVKWILKEKDECKLTELKMKILKRMEDLIEEHKLFTKPYKDKILKILENGLDRIIEIRKTGKNWKRLAELPNQIVKEIYEETFDPYKGQVFIFHLKEEIKKLKEVGKIIL
jgi:hypothetical protein